MLIVRLVTRARVHLRQVGPQPRRGPVPDTLVLLRQLLHEVLDDPCQRRECSHREELGGLCRGGLRGAARAEELRAAREHLQEAHCLLIDDLHGVIHEMPAQERRDREDFGVVTLGDARSEETLGVHEPHLRAIARFEVRAAHPDAHGFRRGPASNLEDTCVAGQCIQKEALPGVVGTYDGDHGNLRVVLHQHLQALGNGDHRGVIRSGLHDLKGLVDLDFGNASCCQEANQHRQVAVHAAATAALAAAPPRPTWRRRQPRSAHCTAPLAAQANYWEQ
mmetsp:Transcript_72287/g.182263  ORF Transcript_72287/g.182263 Transcript_72287/m.182263 type:complete len:278 (+) Transcript_72287:1823-2656(+)